MTKTMFIAVITALVILSGCANEKNSATDESAKIRQLQVDRAQIVQELDTTRNDLNATIKEKDDEIAQLNSTIQELETKLTGFENVVGELITNFQKINNDSMAAREENIRLRDQIATLKAEQAPTADRDVSAKNRLDELNSLKKDEAASE